jgi:hypothetical protein
MLGNLYLPETSIAPSTGTGIVGFMGSSTEGFGMLAKASCLSGGSCVWWEGRRGVSRKHAYFVEGSDTNKRGRLLRRRREYETHLHRLSRDDGGQAVHCPLERFL